MITLSVNDVSQFSYDNQVVSVAVKFRSKDLVYLEILNPEEVMRLPPENTTIFLFWQWQTTLWKQQAVIQRIDRVPLSSSLRQPRAIRWA